MIYPFFLFRQNPHILDFLTASFTGRHALSSDLGVAPGRPSESYKWHRETEPAPFP